MKAELTRIYNANDASLKLLMYRSMLASDKAWLAGFEAAKTDLILDDNPFYPGEDEFKCWENGWWEGFYGEDYSAIELVDELEAWIVASKAKAVTNKAYKGKNHTITDTQAPHKSFNLNKALAILVFILITSVSVNLYLMA